MGNTHTSITKALMIQVVVVMTAVTAIFTAIAFYFDYSNQESELNSTIEIIKVSSRLGLVENLYNYDREQTRNMIGGVAIVPDVMVLRIYDEQDKLFLEVTEEEAMRERKVRELAKPNFEMIAKYLIATQLEDNPTAHGMDITKEIGGKEVYLGRMEFLVTKKHRHAAFIYEALMFFVTQLLKTVLIGFLLMAITRKLVTRHVQDIATFFKDIDWTTADHSAHDKPLQLERPGGGQPDEFDILVDNINEMHRLAKETLAEQAKEVEHYSNEVKVQQAAALNNARLSSLGQMAGGIAHEINNPLTIIQGHCNIIKKQVVSEDIKPNLIEKSFGRISASIMRITEITGGLLAFSRDLQDEKVVETTVKEMVGKIDNLASLVFTQGQVDYSSYWQGADRVVRNCEGPIFQILMALFTNARDAVLSQPEGKKWVKVEVSEGPDGETLVIAVKDSGDGIAVEHQPKIFEPFFTTKPIGQGAGLGLSICHGLAEELGGTITLDQREIHTSFVLTVPYMSARIALADSAGETIEAIAS